VNNNIPPQIDRGAQSFLDRHHPHVTGIISGFERVRLQGTLRILYREQTMGDYLLNAGVLYKDFKHHLRGMSACIRDKSCP